MSDPRIAAVLADYDQRMEVERATPVRELAPGERDERMRPVGPRTGALLRLLAESREAPRILELGTSYGYSTIWLADGARSRGGRVTTIELYEYKSAFARDMAAKAGLSESIDFLVGDAVELIGALDEPVDLVLLDLWKDLYLRCFEAFLPRLSPGAIIVADNMNPERDVISAYGRAVRSTPGMTSIALPIGHKLEISRYEPGGSPYTLDGAHN